MTLSERLLRLLGVVTVLGEDFHAVVMADDRPGVWFAIVCTFDCEGSTPEEALENATVLAEDSYLNQGPWGAGGTLQ